MQLLEKRVSYEITALLDAEEREHIYSAYCSGDAVPLPDLGSESFLIQGFSMHSGKSKDTGTIFLLRVLQHDTTKLMGEEQR